MEHHRIIKDKIVYEVYEFLEIIGSGGYSSVVLGTHNQSGVKRAIKIIDKSKLTDQLAERVKRECDINFMVNHPHIAQVYEIYESEEDISIVMELLEGGELFDHIAGKRRLSEEEARSIFKAILDAVAYLHGLGIAHRDLKPENMLFTSKEKTLIKLIDFGFAKMDNTMLQTPIGTAAYVAPEVTSSEQYSKVVDMWSMGCVLFFMLVGRPPFYSDDEEEIDRLASEGKYSYPDGIQVSDAAKDLIASLLVRDPMKRLTAFQAMKHKWTTGLLNGSQELEEPAPADTEDHRLQLRSAINKTIDSLRNEVDKQTEKNDQDAKQDLGIAVAAESALWQRRASKKKQKETIVQEDAS